MRNTLTLSLALCASLCATTAGAACLSPSSARWSDPATGYGVCSASQLPRQQIAEGAQWQASVPATDRFKVGTVVFTCQAGKLVQSKTQTYCAKNVR